MVDIFLVNLNVRKEDTEMPINSDANRHFVFMEAISLSLNYNCLCNCNILNKSNEIF